MRTGRNDPCTCGSGKKYKQCCLRTETEPAADELVWRRVRRALEPLQKMLMREAADRFGKDGFDEARADFFLLVDDGEDFDADDPSWNPLFFTFAAFDWLPDPHDTTVPDDSHEMTAAEALLLRAGHQLAPIARSYVQACCAGAMSFYDVLEVRHGSGFRARDMVLDSELDVMEKTASQSLLRGDVVFGRVVPIEGIHLIESMGPIAIPPRHKPELIEVLRKLLPRRRHTVDDLREYDYELREIYLTLAERLMHPQRPELRNTDGDPIEAHTLHFDLDAPEAAAKALADLGAGITEPALTYDDSGAFVSAEITWSRAGNATHADLDNTSLGFIRITGKRLTAHVNSQRRAVALRALIEKKLSTTAHVRPTVIQSAQSMVRESRTGEEPPEITPEITAMLTERLRAHYRAWVDEEIPALGGKTPRQAVRTKHGRLSVAALIDQLERDGQSMTPPLDPAIVRELRQTLKLDLGQQKRD